MLLAVKRKFNKKGFTLSESMVSLLILGLVITIIGGGVVVVKNSYQRITLKSHAQTLMSTSITRISEDLRFAEDIDEETVDSSGIIKSPEFTNGETGYRTKFTNDSTKGIMRTYIYGANTKSVGLVSEKTMTDGLISSIQYSYNKNTRIFTVIVTVSSNSTNIAEQKISISPLNNRN